jgi:hypothetical protein
MPPAAQQISNDVPWQLVEIADWSNREWTQIASIGGSAGF